jgi:hypothetical protein
MDSYGSKRKLTFYQKYFRVLIVQQQKNFRVRQQKRTHFRFSAKMEVIGAGIVMPDRNGNMIQGYLVGICYKFRDLLAN